MYIPLKTAAHNPVQITHRLNIVRSQSANPIMLWDHCAVAANSSSEEVMHVFYSQLKGSTTAPQHATQGGRPQVTARLK
jgi:hypothetical protein